MLPNKTTKHGYVKLIQRSNKNLRHLFTDIGMRCWKNEQSKDAYVYRVISEIRKSLSDQKVKGVYLIGHSYGGYVAAEAVLDLKKDPNSHKLVVDTYASIYILSRPDIGKVDMKQYMNRHDLALRCNKIPKDCITWTRRSRSNNIIDEWKIHMDYPLDDIVNNLIKKLNTK
jgi:pimeloyl-ACP methyl ester carboxylesterase